MSNGKVVLEIKIVDSPTWISVQVDGESTHRGTMLPNSVQSFEAEEKVSVTSGKANKTIVTLNGNELGTLGETTNVIRDVIFTRETTIMPESSFSQSPEDKDEKEKEKEE